MLTLERVEEVLEEELGDRVPADLYRRVVARLAAEDARWQELVDDDRFGYHFSIQCPDICLIGSLAADGHRLKVFREMG